MVFCYFSVSFWLRLGSWGIGDPPGTHFSSTAEKGRKQTRFLTVLGSLLETLGAPFGEPFRSLWPPRRPKNRKNDALQGVCSRVRFLIGFSSFFGCLGSLKTTIPCKRGTQNHIFDRSRKKHDFILILLSFYGPFGTMLGTFGSPLELEGACFFVFCRIDFSISFLMDFRPQRGSPKKEHGIIGLDSGAMVKRHVLRKAWLIPRQNATPARWRKRWPLRKGNY